MPIYFGDTKVNPDGIKKVYVGNQKVYEKSVESDDLCFTAQQSNSSVGYIVVGTVNINGIQKSTDGNTWTSWDGASVTLTNIGDKIYVRNTNNTLSTSSSNFIYFTMAGQISANGDISSLINYNSLSNYCYYKMFHGCTSLTTAPSLPATTLTIFCYSTMFYGCTSLTTAPSLPATTLADNCYSSMFRGCTSLTTAPSLPATTLVNRCYNTMFYGCTSLYVSDSQTSQATYEWRIPQTNTFSSTYSQANMFKQCLGSRTSDAMMGVSGNSYYYYTQNQPV